MKKSLLLHFGIVAFTVLVLAGCENPADKPKSTAVNIAAIQGVTAPATGGIPVTAITENAQYKGTVSWNGSPSTFAALTAYTATITLSPKDGYTLKGVKADSFTVAGATSVRNAANSHVITAVFPQTAAASQTPVANDYNIGNITQTAGSVTAVTITPKSGKSTGTVTIYYDGSTTLPTTAGTYTVTFNVAAATGWNAASGLVAGTLTIAQTPPVATPIASVSIAIPAPVRDTVPATTATVNTGNCTTGTVTWSPADNPFKGGVAYTVSVTLTANSGHTFMGLNSATINGQNAVRSNNTGGAVILSYAFPETSERIVTGITIKTQPAKLAYNYGDTLDLTGLAVTLAYENNTTEDIAVADFTAKNISASPSHGDKLSVTAHNNKPVTITYGNKTATTSNLTVNRINPVADDFTVSGLTQTYDGSPKAVTVTAKPDKTTGSVTVKYNGVATAPVNAGTYNVTFDVGADANYNTVTGLSAGTLIIKVTPVATDYEIGNLTQTLGSVTAVTITPKDGKSNGARTVYYTGIAPTTYAKSQTEPTAVGSYTVTFDVAADGNYSAVTGLSAGTLIIKGTPTAADYEIGNMTQTAYSVTAVTITPKSGKSNGARTVYYEGIAPTSYAKSQIVPSVAGSYAVTFNVAVAGNWNVASGLSAGTLTIISVSFITIAEFKTWLDARPANTAATAYTVELNVDNLGGIASASGSAGYVLSQNSNKYVNLDLSSSTITSIGSSTFYDCKGLTSITIGNSVTSIGGGAFSGCSGLTGPLTIPDSVTSIGSSTFFNCGGLTSVTIGNSVTRIWSQAFYGCKGLTSITIGNSVTSIGGGAFSGCSGLTGPLTIPDSVYSIGDSAFQGCKGLTSITIGNSVYSIGDSAFQSCSGLTGPLTIPESVTSIGDWAFLGCHGLTSVTIGNSVTSIGNGAFSSCSGLTAIFVHSSNINYVSENGVLYNKAKTTLIQYPGGKTGIFTIPNSVTSIGKGAFWGCGGLTSVTIGNSVTSIGSQAFEGCRGLTSVTIGNSVTSIGNGAFYSCSGLTSVTIGNSVTSIGSQAFEDCSGLTSVTFQGTIPSSGFESRAFGTSGYSDYIGDLRNKFYATNATNGTPGTYTRASGGTVWTREGNGDQA